MTIRAGARDGNDMGTIDFPPRVWAAIFIVLLAALLVALVVTDWRHRAR